MNAAISIIVAKVGDVLELPVEITEGDGSPVDLTDQVVTFRVWEEGTDVDLLGPIPLSAYNPPTAGIAAIVAGPTYGSLLPRDARYWFDLRVTGGETITQGRFYLAPSRIR